MTNITNITNVTITPESIKILDSQLLTDKHSVIISIDTGNMPKHVIEKYFNDLLKQFKRVLPGIKIVIVPKEFDIQIIEQE